MKQLLYCLVIILAAGCKERYDPPVQSPVTGYLVIDGVVNSGAGATTITLSRTTKLDNRAIVYETGAVVKLEGDNGTVFTMTETATGKYGTNNLNLNNSAKYRLHITVKDGKEFLSDFENVASNPPIDSLSWIQGDDGLKVFVNAHDPQNNTHFYQWTYDETWQITSTYVSALKYKIVSTPRTSYSVVYRDSATYSYDPTIINCWQYFSSSAIILGSTAKLSQDIVYLPVVTVPPASVKLSVLYSVNVKQNALTKEGYEFLEKMRKNTESTGSVFDAQPSELKGNIRCVTDANEPVIGYFILCSLQQKRIFIRNNQVPSWGYQSGCFSVDIENISDSIAQKGLGLLPTVITKSFPSGAIEKFQAASPDCVDCTLRGSNVKPTYWP